MEDIEPERILITPSCIDYVVLGFLDDEVRESADAALGETADVEKVLGVDLKDD